jgi:hypothetical protein
MYFVDNNSAVPVMPQVKPVSSVAPLYFSEGGNGAPPTWPGPDWFNIFQTELLNILKEAGINPDKENHAQLFAAMKKLFLSRSNPFGDIKEDKAVSTAKINLNMQAFNSDDTISTVSAPTSGVFLCSKLWKLGRNRFSWKSITFNHSRWRNRGKHSIRRTSKSQYRTVRIR